MQDLDIVDASFDITHFSNYKLSIQIALNGLSFCVLDKLSGKYILLKQYTIKQDLLKEDYYQRVDDIIQGDEHLNGNFDTVKAMFITDKSTIIPSSFFNPFDLKKYFEFNHKMDDLDEIHYDELKSVDAYIIYTIPNQMAVYMTRKFPNLHFFHHTTPFITYHVQKNVSIVVKKVFVQLNHSFFDIIITKADKLLLYNSFRYKNADDFIFFVNYVFNHFDLPPDNTELILQGSTSHITRYEQQLSEYIKMVTREKLNSDYLYTETIINAGVEQFINLFNLDICE